VIEVKYDGRGNGLDSLGKCWYFGRWLLVDAVRYVSSSFAEHGPSSLASFDSVRPEATKKSPATLAVMNPDTDLGGVGLESTLLGEL
jgi:hypothetical protein